jgi:DNA polymerase-3 subunit gamma/tau
VCASCAEIGGGHAVDVIEIDAASNRGINEMRELRESVRYRPARDRYKVFIVDEAHQITSEAFNALLKTLEEPPEWVVFVLCTTEAHKIPSTIASRCQQFSFRSVDFSEVVGRMEWICTQEGIEADADALAVLAQAGEGSVRDSLSALDQAIACCGNRLTAPEVRGLLGMFSLESLGQVAEALRTADTRAMLDIVMELERNGRNLQHFCRELSRYFRNLLVAKVAGANTKLIAASPAEQERMAALAAAFSEEDLTRYLQITLDIYRDLQFSLQPRFHLELGLLRMVHAGKLLGIEEALGMLGPSGTGGPASTPPPKSSPPKAAPSPSLTSFAEAPRTPAPPPPRTAPVASVPPSAPGDWKSRLVRVLLDMDMKFTADAMENSTVTEEKGELKFVTPETFRFAMSEKDLRKAAEVAGGRPYKISVTTGEVQPAPSTAAAAAAAKPEESESSRRAMEHPEVKQFQEAFPDAQVRAVRNLRE